MVVVLRLHLRLGILLSSYTCIRYSLDLDPASEPDRLQNAA